MLHVRNTAGLLLPPTQIMCGDSVPSVTNSLWTSWMKTPILKGGVIWILCRGQKNVHGLLSERHR